MTRVKIDEPDPTLDELKSTRWACEFWGGDRPVNPSTLWRWVREGKIPPPRKIGKNVNRFVKAEQVAARERMLKQAVQPSSDSSSLKSDQSCKRA